MATLTTNIAVPTSRTAASPSCTTAVPDNHGHVPFGACNSYYNDDPSFEANLAFAALFGVSFLAHIVQAIVYKKRFCWVLIMGAAWETAAFSNRTLGAHNQQERQYALWGQLLFLLAPLSKCARINAFAYMTVARMVYFGLPDKKRRKEARKTGEFSGSHDMERLAEEIDGDDVGANAGAGRSVGSWERGPVHDRVSAIS
ncbi:hypothetical protein ARSEF4850_006339 [Beauveria asiatica]